MLFHNFLENPATGGSKLDPDLIQLLNVTYLINPIPTAFGKRNCFNFYKKYQTNQPTYLSPKPPYDTVIQRFGPQRPTTGFAALLLLLTGLLKNYIFLDSLFLKHPMELVTVITWLI